MCTDPPDYLRISTQSKRYYGTVPTSGTSKFPWDEENLQEVLQLRKKGLRWKDIAQILSDETGISIKEDAVQARVHRAEEEM